MLFFTLTWPVQDIEDSNKPSASGAYQGTLTILPGRLKLHLAGAVA